MSQGLSEVVEKEGIAAIREPKARPSNVWWKQMAIRRTMKAGPEATETAMPMKIAVEEDAGFEEEALENEALVVGRGWLVCGGGVRNGG